MIVHTFSDILPFEKVNIFSDQVNFLMFERLLANET
nr:MAG TPA: hypothetical protein [Caudoviricetes sp.]